jgi:hypothetical protein
MQDDALAAIGEHVSKVVAEARYFNDVDEAWA